VRLGLALALSVLTGSAYATGSPAVLFWGAGAFLTLTAGLIWVTLAAKPWSIKMRASIPLVAGLGFVALLFQVPGYQAHHLWIDGGVALSVIVALIVAVRILKKG
jgi:hypothetical protein